MLKIIISALCLLVAVFGCEYRRISPQHTMCIYAARTCKNSQMLRSGGVLQRDKSLILRIHNELRSKVASGKIRGLPAAVNMKVMTWDNELAKIAQRWADQCTEGHDSSRDIARFPVGQNVALQWTYSHRDPQWKDRSDWISNIHLWEKEYNEFGFPSNHINPFTFKYDVGHYTQMIWGETHKIGCGYSFYKHPSKGYTKIYVCNYGPGGNLIGGKMYETTNSGPKCTDPSLISSKQYEGLCDYRAYYNNRRRHANSFTRSLN